MTRTLDGLGDSLLVVGGPDLWNVHVHVDDPGAAVEAGVAAGRPERIRITHFASQMNTRDQPVPLAVVACAAGPGIGALLREAGAVVVASRPGRRASAGQLLHAVESTGSAAVVVLPGDRDTFMAAEIAAQAAAGAGIDVHVVPARTTVQALAALAVLDPGRSVHANVVSMTGAAVATRHGAVSVATKEALTWAGVCHPGDVLGIVDGDVAFLGTDVAVAAREVLDRLLSAGGELVTLVVGADADAGLGDGVAAALGHDRPELEVVVIDGGQPVYPLLIGVE
jgi:dihydroxyacetone kinase-like predicted kinase